MSLHLTILLWLGIIFVIAASIILGLLLKSKKEERKESYLGFTVIFYIFDLLYSSTYSYLVYYSVELKNKMTLLFCSFYLYLYVIFINNSSNMIY